MIIIESILLTLLLMMCIIVTYTDFKTGLIPNKILVYFGVIILILDTVYYSIFQAELIWGFILNITVNMLFSILLYAYAFWGAGDSKLMILSVLAIPARFYASDIFSVPIIIITVQTFAIAFCYLAIESIALGIIKKDLFNLKVNITKSKILLMLKNYMISYIYIIFFSFVLNFTINNKIAISSYIIPICSFFIVFTVFNFGFFQKKAVIGIFALIDVLLMILFNANVSSFFPPLWNLIVISIVFVFRSLSAKYNYHTIPTSDIKQGMVLSLNTIMQFKSSRGKGLPEITTEDFRSRISSEDADSIKRWGNSKNGSSEIIIVRKLPFAVFITAGIVAFLGLRMWIS